MGRVRGVGVIGAGDDSGAYLALAPLAPDYRAVDAPAGRMQRYQPAGAPVANYRGVGIAAMIDTIETGRPPLSGFISSTS